MKNLLVNFSIPIVCLILFFFFGYNVGRYNIPDKQYNQGIVSFCQLNGGDKIKVCPYLRTMEIFGKGTITTYVCKRDFSHVYIETNNISEISAIELEESFHEVKRNIFVKHVLIWHTSSHLTSEIVAGNVISSK